MIPLTQATNSQLLPQPKLEAQKILPSKQMDSTQTKETIQISGDVCSADSTENTEVKLLSEELKNSLATETEDKVNILLVLYKYLA